MITALPVQDDNILACRITGRPHRCPGHIPLDRET